MLLSIRRVRVIVFVGLTLICGCGKGERKQQAGVDPQNSGTSAPAAPATPSADETAALSNLQFGASPMIALNGDAYESTQRLQALNGVDPKSTYGAAYELNDFNECSANSNAPPDISLSTQFPAGAVMAWLEREHILSVATYMITYPNAQYPNYGTANRFTCPLLTDKIRELFPSVKNADIHHGIRFPIGQRVFLRWTYENRYETAVPGKGMVKIFAGTFSYRLDTNLPGVSFGGPGSGTVKMYLDPDTGRWAFSEYMLSDPSVILATQ